MSESTRILVVDDEAPQMKALCDTLRDQGYDPAGFTAGSKALEALRAERFTLILTDLMMPEMDGIALLRAAREIDPDLVGVMMTGHGTIDTAVEAMKAGALDYILKPFKLSAILPVLSRALTVRRLRLENEELMRQVQDRTSELEAANKELEAFSFSVSHDLRAPLRAVRGFGDMLQQDYGPKLPEEARDLLDRMLTGATRMGQLIEDLLGFSRLGRQAMAKQEMDLSEVARRVLDELLKEQPDRQVEIRFAELGLVNGDASLLRQVFTNLFSNALKFTRQVPQAIIEVGITTQDGAKVYFVKDNGAGFDMRYAEKLFGVFQRMHGMSEFEGTGIGLSIVQRIIQRHGGQIWADAAVGRGATFFFTLPS